MKYLLPGISIILLVLVVGGAAYYFGKQSTLAPSATPTPTVSKAANTNLKTTPTLTETPVKTKTVAAGGVLSFPTYTLITPSDWNSQREQGEDSDKLTLTKGGYKIVISEGAFGGSGCLYPGDPPQEMGQTFTSYVEILNPNGFIFRRSSTGISGWTVCQKGNEGSFGTPTIFGHISITAPSTPDTTIITEIDSILASIKK